MLYLVSGWESIAVALHIHYFYSTRGRYLTGLTPSGGLEIVEHAVLLQLIPNHSKGIE